MRKRVRKYNNSIVAGSFNCCEITEGKQIVPRYNLHIVWRTRIRRGGLELRIEQILIDPYHPKEGRLYEPIRVKAVETGASHLETSLKKPDTRTEPLPCVAVNWLWRERVSGLYIITHDSMPRYNLWFTWHDEMREDDVLRVPVLVILIFQFREPDSWSILSNEKSIVY